MTANVISQVMHSQVVGAPAPKVGDGLSVCMWSDRHAGTVVEVINPNLVAFTEDDAKADTTRPCPMGHQNWILTPQPDGHRQHAMCHKDGRWYVAKLGKHGRYTVSKKSTPVAMGQKSHYHDWSF